MRIPFQRGREPSAATRARIKAEEELERIKAQTPPIRELAESLIQVQRENHLGRSIANVFRGDR